MRAIPGLPRALRGAPHPVHADARAASRHGQAPRLPNDNDKYDNNNEHMIVIHKIPTIMIMIIITMAMMIIIVII